MASKVNTKFLLILFIVGGSLFAAMGGFYLYFTRSSAAHNLARAAEFEAEGDYRKAFSYYSRALGEDPLRRQQVPEQVDLGQLGQTETGSQAQHGDQGGRSDQSHRDTRAVAGCSTVRLVSP